MSRSHFIQFSIIVLIILIIYLTYNYINKSRKDLNIVEKTELNKLVEKKLVIMRKHWIKMLFPN